MTYANRKFNEKPFEAGGYLPFGLIRTFMFVGKKDRQPKR